jgi:hypothetical protein
VLSPLHDKLDTILSEADATNWRFYTLYAVGASADKVLGAVFTALDRKTESEQLLAASPELWSLRNEQVLLLLTLHNTLSDIEKAQFVSILQQRIQTCSPHSSYLLATLARLGLHWAGFSSLISSMNFVLDESIYRGLLYFSDFIKYDNIRLSDEDIEAILRDADPASERGNGLAH